jgi:DNA-binding response OmpR family regulator
MAEFLLGELQRTRFEVVPVRSGRKFLSEARPARPHIAVIDHVHERPDAAQLMIDILKDIREDVRIIAVSERSSGSDADIVEQGVYYYMTTSGGAELVQIIEAADRALGPAAAD